MIWETSYAIKISVFSVLKCIFLCFWKGVSHWNSNREGVPRWSKWRSPKIFSPFPIPQTPLFHLCNCQKKSIDIVLFERYKKTSFALQFSCYGVPSLEGNLTSSRWLNLQGRIQAASNAAQAAVNFCKKIKLENKFHTAKYLLDYLL